ncbi:unnamed protein product, partial [Rhizoctonia solani]
MPMVSHQQKPPEPVLDEEQCMVCPSSTPWTTTASHEGVSCWRWAKAHLKAASWDYLMGYCTLQTAPALARKPQRTDRSGIYPYVKLTPPGTGCLGVCGAHLNALEQGFQTSHCRYQLGHTLVSRLCANDLIYHHLPLGFVI